MASLRLTTGTLSLTIFTKQTFNQNDTKVLLLLPMLRLNIKDNSAKFVQFFYLVLSISSQV
jgi:hypothetical protein